MLLLHSSRSRMVPAFLLFVISLSTGVPAQHSRQESQNASQRELSSREVFQKVSKALVLIVTQDKEGQPIAQASGFFFKDGLVATNLHVFKRASQGYIKLLNSETTYNIEAITGINRRHDLCVFRVNGAPAVPLSIHTIKSSVGDDVYAAGNPKGLEGTFSKGIISSIRSEQGLIQIDAAISSGSSGGPVVNSRAEVIGVAVSSLVNGQNLNFAVPAAYLQATLQNWNASIDVAGALSLTDRDQGKLQGPVRRVITSHTAYMYNQQTDKYEEANLNIQTRQFIKGPPELLKSISYNYEGNQIEQVNYKDSVFRKIEKEYDEEGFISRGTITDNAGKQTVTEFTKRESINLKFSNRNYSTTSKLEYKDASGNIHTGISTTYDRDGNEIEYIHHVKGERITRRFDSDGNEIEESVYKNDKLEESYRYTYEFDKFGNWTKQICTSYNPKFSDLGYTPFEAMYREITYHNFDEFFAKDKFQPPVRKPVAMQENVNTQGYIESINGVGIEMVRVPAGKFLMGSSDEALNKHPQHEVTISRSFYIGKYEVTQAQWKAVARLPKVKIDLNADPSYFKGNNLPVEQVSWDEAVEFCERLSKATGKTFRLPTEAEWEYACRAGTSGMYAGNLDEPDFKTHPVGQKKPNSFGLYDMHGNVWEWCADWGGDYSSEAQTDPTGPSTGSYRVLHGGLGFNNYTVPILVGCADCEWLRPSERSSLLGFRLVRTYN